MDLDLYTAVLRQSGRYWVALYLENGIVDQEETQDGAITKLKEAIESFEEVRETEIDIYCAPISTDQLHEFLAIDMENLATKSFELRVICA